MNRSKTRVRPVMFAGIAVAATGLLLAGCASERKEVPPAPAKAAAPAPEKPAPAPAAARPAAAEAELIVLTAKVTAIDRKNRVVSLKGAEGKQVKIKVGPEARNLAQLRVGDEVTLEYLIAAEIAATKAQGKPSASDIKVVERAMPGKKPGGAAVHTVEVSALVEAIDYQTREVKLKGPEGRVFKVKAGPEVKRLNEVKQGDMVVVRLTEAISIKVTAPKSK